MKTHLLTLLCFSLCVGCATQPSTYEDTSTKDQRNIKATGSAATEAAKSNTSRHSQTESATTGLKLSHIEQYDLQNGRYVVIGPDGKRDHRAELRLLQQNAQYRKPGYGEYASDRFSREFDYRLKRSIDRKVDEWIKKVFD
jgi:hypothetical protein